MGIARFPEDVTGTKYSNLVVNEEHTLDVSVRNRALVTNEGAFFGDSTFIIKDKATNLPLTAGTQYKFVHIDQDASIRTGKSIYYGIIIIDSNVSSNVTINYQCLGGYYSNNNPAIKEAYENLMLDSGQIDWSNITNKPSAYPPTLHNNLLSDIYGFQPIIGALDRLGQAIQLGNVPGMQAILDYGEWRWGHVENLPVITDAEAITGSLIHKYVTYDRLLTYINQFIVGSSTSAVNVETSARIAGDQNLANLIASIRDSLTAALTSGNSTLAEALAQEILNSNNTLNAALQLEITNRTNADTGLSNAIAAETLSRTNADNALSTAINSEATARANADASEVTNRNNAITAAMNTLKNNAYVTYTVSTNPPSGGSNGDIWYQI